MIDSVFSEDGREKMDNSGQRDINPSMLLGDTAEGGGGDTHSSTRYVSDRDGRIPYYPLPRRRSGDDFARGGR